jgi:hypothetical protein
MAKSVCALLKSPLSIRSKHATQPWLRCTSNQQFAGLRVMKRKPSKLFPDFCISRYICSLLLHKETKSEVKRHHLAIASEAQMALTKDLSHTRKAAPGDNIPQIAHMAAICDSFEFLLAGTRGQSPT